MRAPKPLRVPLLFKGDDFAKTDVNVASSAPFACMISMANHDDDASNDATTRWPPRRPASRQAAGTDHASRPLDHARPARCRRSTPRRSMRARTARRAATASGPICSTGRSPPRRFRRRRRAQGALGRSAFFCRRRQRHGARGRLSGADADRAGSPRDRGRQHHVYAGDAADGGGDRSAISVRPVCLRRPRQPALRMEVQRPQRALEARRRALRLRVRGGVPPAHDRQGPQPRHRVVRHARQRVAGAEGGLRALARARQFRWRGRQKLRLSDLMPRAAS